MNSIIDNKELSKTIRSFLSDEVTAQTEISLAEKGKLFSNEKKVEETFSNFCLNAHNKIGINKDDAKFNDETSLLNI